jgi:hypothetical protein
LDPPPDNNMEELPANAGLNRLQFITAEEEEGSEKMEKLSYSLSGGAPDPAGRFVAEKQF